MKKLVSVLLVFLVMLAPTVALADAPDMVNTYVIASAAERLPRQNGLDVSRVVTKTYQFDEDGNKTIDVEAVYTFSIPEDQIGLASSMMTTLANPGSSSNSVVTVSCGFTMTAGYTTATGTRKDGYRMSSYWAKAVSVTGTNYVMTSLARWATQGAGNGFPCQGGTPAFMAQQRSYPADISFPTSGTKYSVSTGFTYFFLNSSDLDAYATVHYKILPSGSEGFLSVSAQG